MINGRMAAVAFISLTLSAAAAGAQVIGFKLGPTFSNISTSDESTEQSTLTSFGGGGFIRFGLAGLSLQPEVLALTKGTKGTGLDIPGEFKLKLHYIEIPVFARFGLGTGSFSPYLMVGPSFSFETKCEAEFEGSGTTVSGECQDEGGDTLPRKKFDLGGAAALGFEFKLGPGNILVEGRYTHGITNIADSETEEVRNRMFGVFAGYSIILR